MPRAIIQPPNYSHGRCPRREPLVKRSFRALEQEALRAGLALQHLNKNARLGRGPVPAMTHNQRCDGMKDPAEVSYAI